MLKISHFIFGSLGVVLAILGGLSQMMPDNKKIAHIDSVAVNSAQSIVTIQETIQELQGSPSFVISNKDTVYIKK